MGTDYTVTHAADLAANLPRESCSWTAENPVNGWTRDQQLLALIEHHLATWNWWHSKDGKNEAKRPKLLISTQAADGPEELMTREELDGFISGLMEPEPTET